MTKYYLPAKFIFTVLLLSLCSFTLQAQNFEYLNSNNVNAGIGTGGNLFTKVDSIGRFGNGLVTGVTWNQFETPPGTGKSEVFTSALWLGGYDTAGIYHCAANTYFGYGVDFYDGPIAANYDSNYDQYYHRVFKVTQTQISQFRNLTFPANPSRIDSAILYWPGAGNVNVFSDYGVPIDSPLAPFVDINHNGIYEPLQGEYPAIPGDQGIFFVFNDIRGPHTEGGGIPIGVEIRGLASCFTDLTNPNTPYYKNAINNSIFVQYQIENKSQQTFPLLHIGLFTDPDIGCYNNDYVGCDSARSLMFAYNAVAYDSDCAPALGYDSVPVALGVQVLSLPLEAFFYFTGLGSAYPSDPVPVDICHQAVYFLQGIGSDSSIMEYGGIGYHNGGRQTHYCFPGDPADSTEWSDVSAHLSPTDSKMLGVSNALNFVPGQTLHYDLAWTSARDSGSNYLSIVDSLKIDADTVRSFYQQHVLRDEQVLGVQSIHSSNSFTVSVYPVPASDQVTIISTGDNIQSIELLDMEGRVIFKKNVEARYINLPLQNLSKGVYLVNVFSRNNSVVSKVVVE